MTRIGNNALAWLLLYISKIVGYTGIVTKLGQQCCYLPAMVCLMIEHVRNSQPDRMLSHLAG